MPNGNAIVVYQLRDRLNSVPAPESERMRIGRPQSSLAFFQADSSDPKGSWVSAPNVALSVKKPAGSTAASVGIDLVIVSSDGGTFLTPSAGGLRFKRGEDEADAGDSVFGGFVPGTTGPVTVNGKVTASVPCLTITDNCSEGVQTAYSLFMMFAGIAGVSPPGLLDPRITNN